MAIGADGSEPVRAPGFNTNPQSGDWDSAVFEGHDLVERVRGENTDTDDAFAIMVQGVATTTKVFNVRKDGVVFGGSTSYAVLSATSGITLGAAAAAGVGQAALRYDAQIKAFQAVNPNPVGSVATYGSSSLASRDDHVHLGVASVEATGASPLYGAVDFVAGAGIGLTQSGQGITIMASTAVPAGASVGLPALILGPTNVAGGTNFIGVSSTVQLYDGTAPSTWAFGTAAAVGGGSFAARSNHVHGVGSLATPALVFGTTASVGSGPLPFGADARVILFTANVAATVAASNTTGIANFAAREDHHHALGGSYVSGGQSAMRNITTDITTTSGTYVTASPCSIPLVTTGGDVIAHFTGNGKVTTIDVAFFTLFRDGTDVAAGTSGLNWISESNAGQDLPISFVWRIAAESGAHTYDVRWKRTAGTATLRGDPESTFVVQELPH